MTDIEITKISLTELAQLQLIGRQTFFETFASGNTAENLQAYMEEGFSADKLTAELTNPSSEFYFARLDNRIVGYLKLNSGEAQTEAQDNEAFEIERIYVLKEFHGKKVGQVLFDTAVDRAKQAKVAYLWLGVWEENPRAISFYKKNGFVEFGKHLFILGDDEQTDIMMKLEMSAAPASPYSASHP